MTVIIDGKYFRKEQIVYAIGIINTGFKKILGFIFTYTENAEAVKGLLKNILARGLQISGRNIICGLWFKRDHKGNKEMYSVSLD